ncbi:MAG TPA: AMP-binding protein, partial [Pyrinomonadaceae bacterium]|nr:AMP-binding protein [Pyrinomonadaceae bacterium]
MNVEFPERFRMGDYFLYHNLEEGRGGKVCLYFGEETFTYADAARRSNRAGGALRELGARTEDRVLIALPDCPEFAWAWFGANRVGAVITMVNPLLPADDYGYYLEYTRARVAVIHESLVESFARAAKGARDLKNVLVVGKERGRFHSFAEVSEAQPDELTPADTHRDDPAIWLFTSGSTGRPKGAVHLQHDLPYNTECYAKGVLGLNENDLTVSVPKLFFGYATGTNLLFPFAAGGATALFSERSTPEKMFETIERFRATVLTSVPTMINSMLNVEGAAQRDLSSLRMCLSAG